MQRAILSFASLFLVLSLHSAVPWEQIASTVGGRQVQVQDVDNTRYRGVVREVTGEEIVLIQENGEPVTIARPKVKRVKVKSRARGALIGGLALGVPGTLLSWGLSDYLRNEGPSEDADVVLGLGTAISIGGGAGLGAAMGAMSTVYKAPKTAESARRRLPEPFPIPYAVPRDEREASNAFANQDSPKNLPEYLAR